MKDALFYLVIFLSNIIQGITGFAGTILAMPFSIRLVGIDVAVPVLNLLGLLSGIYVVAGNRKDVDTRILKPVIPVMGISLLTGLFVRHLLSANVKLLHYILGIIVVLVALQGLFKKYISHNDSDREHSKICDILILISAGLVHGMYVCGGPLLVCYLTKKAKKANVFRATCSTIWILLNGTIFITHIVSGAFTTKVIIDSLIAVPVLLLGMFVGSRLFNRISRDFFILLTYILLLIAGLSLFIN